MSQMNLYSGLEHVNSEFTALYNNTHWCCVNETDLGIYCTTLKGVGWKIFRGGGGGKKHQKTLAHFFSGGFGGGITSSKRYIKSSE